ncbi:MAG: tetratricopeptide repeat protein, partial [Chthoniobacterales bacterium]
MDRGQAQELMQQFAALGYIEDPNASKEKQQDSAEVEAKYNLARLYLWKNRPEQALPLLSEITQKRPWEDRFLVQLTVAYLLAGYLKQAERLLTSAYDLEKPGNPIVPLLWGRIKFALGEMEEGLRGFRLAEEMNRRLPAVYNYLGDVYVRMLRWADARQAYEKALELDEENALAYQGLSSVYRRLGMNQEATDAALRAVSLLHRLPEAHFNLGVAMARSGEYSRAVTAFEMALRFQPNLANAHRYLATLHRNGGDPAKGEFHRREAMRIAQARRSQGDRAAERREKLFDLPVIPNQQERIETLLKERPDPKAPEEDSGKTFVLVSGLPRSGTSLMMQMLEAGGLPPKTDGERAADVDNPKGYYEWEAIKQIAKTPELLDEAGLEGRAIKCISMLLPQLPPQHRYRVIFMTRAIEEVVASQGAMVKRLATKGAQLADEQLERGLTVHRNETRSWLANAPHVDFIEIDYRALIQDAPAAAARVVEFLGAERLPASEKMASVVDASLYRRKGTADA